MSEKPYIPKGYSYSDQNVANMRQLKAEQQAMEAIEENKGLKAYIDRMNNECLELNAALFEESNNMIRTAEKKRIAAEKHAKEKDGENEMLQSEVSALKALIAELSSAPPRQTAPLQHSRPSITMIRSKHSTTPEPSSSGPSHSSGRVKGLPISDRLNFRRSSRTSSISTVSMDHLKCPDDHSGNANLQIDRRKLLDALLAFGGRPKDADKRSFQEFIQWIDGGCELLIPCENEDDADEQSSMAGSVGSQSLYRRIVVTRIAQSKQQKKANTAPVGSDIDEDSAEEDDGDHRSNQLGRAPKQYQSLQNNVSNHCVASQLSNSTAATPLTKPSSTFMHRLYREDVRACLNFADRRLTEAICRALPSLSLEIVLLARLSVSTPVTPMARMSLNDSCPLMPGHRVKFQLKIKDPDIPASLNRYGLDETVCNICAPARDRIVAVTSLFQYLSLIKRGLIRNHTEEPTATEMDSSDDDEEFNLPDEESKLRLKQFANVQRYRLALSMARLGFGLPEVE